MTSFIDVYGIILEDMLTEVFKVPSSSSDGSQASQVDNYLFVCSVEVIHHYSHFA